MTEETHTVITPTVDIVADSTKSSSVQQPKGENSFVYNSIPKLGFGLSLVPAIYSNYKKFSSSATIEQRIAIRQRFFQFALCSAGIGAVLRYSWEEMKYRIEVDDTTPELFSNRSLLSFGLLNLITFAINPKVGVFAAFASLGCETTRGATFLINKYYNDR